MKRNKSIAAVFEESLKILWGFGVNEWIVVLSARLHDLDHQTFGNYIPVYQIVGRSVGLVGASYSRQPVWRASA